MSGDRRFDGPADNLTRPERLERLQPEQTVRLVMERVQPKNAADVGAGTGLFAGWLLRQGIPVSACDVNPAMAEAARERLPEINMSVAPAEALPWADASIDLLFYSMVLHEVDDLGAALREARRVARRAVAVLEWEHKEEEIGPPLDHRLSLDTLRAAALDAGFVEVERLPHPNHVLALLWCETAASSQTAPETETAGEPLKCLVEGMPVLLGNGRVTRVSPELAASFKEGDRLIADPDSGALLHIPAQAVAMAEQAVAQAHTAFGILNTLPDTAITAFYERFAERLEDDSVWAEISEANAQDVASARARGRSTTRLEVSEKMRKDMAQGLRAWAAAPSRRNSIVERLEHDGWTVEQLIAPLGVVGFVFEGRPNVFADATGVLRSGNTCVLRIGRDALGTAQAIMSQALDPALAAAGLPQGAVTLLNTPSHAGGWALFSHPLLALAVARGSGQAVAQLGAIARAAGIPVSLHGTGGAWMAAAPGCPSDLLSRAVYHSLDRKVCNTLNTLCLPRTHATELVQAALDALTRAAERRDTHPRLHVVSGSESCLPEGWLDQMVDIRRADGVHQEPKADIIDPSMLSREWEWEDSPEISLVLVKDLSEAAELCNRYSPHFVVSCVGASSEDEDRFFHAVDAPFMGNGFTRWVDGQYALNRPELGLSNWERGRLFARGAILSGDGVYTIRTRVRQADPDIHR